MTTDLPVPDEAVAEFARTQNLPDPCGLVSPGGGGVNWPAVHADVAAIATPVAVAELLALAEKVAALHGNGGPTYRDGYDAAIGAVRELIADRCDELGVKVEEL